MRWIDGRRRISKLRMEVILANCHDRMIKNNKKERGIQYGIRKCGKTANADLFGGNILYSGLPAGVYMGE